MKTIGVVNNKGGVGKTTISRLLAEYWALHRKKRVLLVDMDAQASLSNRFLNMEHNPSDPKGYYPPLHPDYDPNDPDDADWGGRSSIADIFFGEPVIPYPTYIENLDIAPAWASRLLRAERVTQEDVESKVHSQLRSWCLMPDVQSVYDIMVVDSAPAKGPTTAAVLRASNYIVIPTIMDTLGIEGLYGMLQFWATESRNRAANDPLKLVGVIPNMLRSTNQDLAMLEDLQRNEAIRDYVLDCALRLRTAFKEADIQGARPRSVLSHSPSRPERKEVERMCKMIHKRVFM